MERSVWMVGTMIAAALLSGCMVEGSGVEATRSMALQGDFRGIEVVGASNVTVYACSCDAARVEITTDDNLLDAFEFEIEGGVLEIAEEGWMAPTIEPEIRIWAPGLDYAEVAGSGDLEVAEVVSHRFEARIAGSGNIRLQGYVDHLVAEIAGSGDLNAIRLRAEDADLDIAGSGNIEACVRQRLDATIAGSGDIKYGCQPAHVDISIAGSGSVSELVR